MLFYDNLNVSENQVVNEMYFISNEFCSFIEKCENYNFEQFLVTLSRFLPLLYIKGSVLPEVKLVTDLYIESNISEEDYENIRNKLKQLLKKIDLYIEPENPSDVINTNYEKQTISEIVSDIYQNLKNFVLLYKEGTDEIKQDAVFYCRYTYIHDWGYKITSVMRILHYHILQLENKSKSFF